MSATSLRRSLLCLATRPTVSSPSACRPVVLGGDWVFASCLFGEAAAGENEYLRTVASRLGSAERHALQAARGAAGPYILGQLHEVGWSEYDVVGFTSSCEQNTASLAMARLVKKRHPGCTVVFGGANWEEVMGLAQMERFPFVDIAFLGEADLALPLVVDRLSGRKTVRCRRSTTSPASRTGTARASIDLPPTPWSKTWIPWPCRTTRTTSPTLGRCEESLRRSICGCRGLAGAGGRSATPVVSAVSTAFAGTTARSRLSDCSTRCVASREGGRAVTSTCRTPSSPRRSSTR